MPTSVGYPFIRVCLKGLFSDPCDLTSSSNEFAILDDTQLFLRRLKPSTIQTSLQSGLTLASDSFQGNGMTTNPNKCLSMWFGTDTDDLSVSLNGIVTFIAITMLLLGVSIDKDLNFNVHVKETSSLWPKSLKKLSMTKYITI